MTTTQDRVSYSYGFKVPGAEQYSSVNVSVSLSTDVRGGETVEQAMERARAFVHAQSDRDSAAPAAAGSRVDDETFDPNNQNHRNLARLVFEHEGIKPERHEAKIKYVLKGCRVGDIGKLIRDDEERFRNQRQGPKSARTGRW